MSITLNLTEKQCGALIHSLRVAAERFEEHATKIGEFSEELGPRTNFQPYTFLIDQFRQQASESRQLACIIEAAEQVAARFESNMETVQALHAVGESDLAVQLENSILRAGKL